MKRLLSILLMATLLAAAPSAMAKSKTTKKTTTTKTSSKKTSSSKTSSKSSSKTTTKKTSTSQSKTTTTTTTKTDTPTIPSNAIVATSATNFAKTGVYCIKQDIHVGALKIGDGSTLYFDGGKIIGASISANNLKIVPKDDAVCFQNCNFTGSVVNSSLKATNFGCVADMSSTSKQNWTYKGLAKQTIQVRQGTDNFNAMTRVALFLTGSSNVDFEWNGSFYTAHQTNAKIFAPPYMHITDCNNLKMHGGTLISGIRFIDSKNVEVYNMNFVGYHSCHDFPAIHSTTTPSKETKVNGTSYTASKNGKLSWGDNCYNYGTDGTKDLGLAAEAIVFDANTGKTCTYGNVHDCHMEMRLNGVCFGMKSVAVNYSNGNDVTDMTLKNCTFSHFYYQPIGIHAHNVVVENVSGDYALQPIDISTLSSNVSVKKATFTDTFYGPKQESSKNYEQYSYGNSMEDCSFTVNDKFKLVDMTGYVLNISEGKQGDTFVAKNCKFIYTSNMYSGHVVRLQHSGAEFVNCTFKINLTKQKESEKYSSLCIFASYATTQASPHYEFKNCDIEVNGSSYKTGGTTYNSFAYLFGKVGVKHYSVTMDGCNIHGTARTDWSLFEQMDDVTLSNTTLGIGGCDYRGNLINTPQNLKMTNCKVTAKMSSDKALVSVPSNNTYNYNITGTTVDGSVGSLFNKTPSTSKVKVSSVKTTDGRRTFKSDGTKK